MSSFEVQNDEKSIFHVFPHIFCVTTVINVIGIQDYFIEHDAIADDCLYLISKLLHLGIEPPDLCVTVYKSLTPTNI